MAGGIEWLPSWKNGVKMFDQSDEPGDRSYVGIGIYVLPRPRSAKSVLFQISLIIVVYALQYIGIFPQELLRRLCSGRGR
jgi:hypothetical protein